MVDDAHFTRCAVREPGDVEGNCQQYYGKENAETEGEDHEGSTRRVKPIDF